MENTAVYIYKKTNLADMIESRVVVHTSGGFSVTLWDLDCDMSVIGATIFKSLEDAKRYADKIVSGETFLVSLPLI